MKNKALNALIQLKVSEINIYFRNLKQEYKRKQWTMTLYVEIIQIKIDSKNTILLFNIKKIDIRLNIHTDESFNFQTNFH